MDITFEQFLIGVLLLLLESALIFAWGFRKVAMAYQPKTVAVRLPTPAPMLPMHITINEHSAVVSQRRNGRWTSQRLVPLGYA